MRRLQTKMKAPCGAKRVATEEVIHPRLDTEDSWLNQSQKDYLAGTFDIHAPIEAYTETWMHESDKDGNFIRAYPVEGTRVRRDLPPLVNQWKHDWNRRRNNG